MVRMRWVIGVMLAMLLLAGGVSVSTANAAVDLSATKTPVSRIIVSTELATQSIASDTAYPVRVAYGTSPTQACWDQGHAAAQVWNPWANGWYCVDASYTPPFVAPAGMVDFPAYCSRYYPGSQAVNRDNSLFGWKCERVEMRDI